LERERGDPEGKTAGLPLRKSPGAFEVVEVLGKEKTLERLRKVQKNV